MARTGISKKQVFEAASALLEEGTAATVQAVRERIGSGSFTTITRHLADWRKEHTAQAPAVLPDMPDKVTGAFRQAWSTAVHAAQEAVDTQRQALEVLRREMEQEKADMAAEIERLEQTGEDAAAAREALEKEREVGLEAKAEAEQRASALRIENARLEERAKAARAAQAEADARRDVLEALRREMEQETVRMAAEIGQLKKAIDQATERDERQSRELEEAREAGAEKDERINALAVESARMAEQATGAQARGDELKKQLERLEDKLAAQPPKSRQPRRTAKPKTSTGTPRAPAPKKAEAG